METLKKLHAAAATLVREKGVAATTIDEIAERANVSRRTFFNYYDSKEDAILGLVPPRMPAEQSDAFFASEVDVDPLTRAVRLTMAVSQSIKIPGVTREEIRELVAQFPELREVLKRNAQRTHELVLATMTDRPSEAIDGADFNESLKNTDDVADQALVLFLTAGAVFRFMQMKDPDLVGPVQPEAADAAIAVFRTVFKDFS